MSQLILGVVLVLPGAVSLWDAARINSKVRQPGSFDLVGPDGYLAGAALVLVVLGAALFLQGLRARRPVALPGDDASSSREIALTLALVAYAIALPLAGYVVSTLAFAVAGFWTMGIRHWPRNIVAAVALTAVLHVLFARVAGIVLPAGPWGV